MKKLVLLAIVMSSGILAFAQSNKQVKWTFSSKKIGDKMYEVRMTANINGNWHMYSQDAGEGPAPTVFTFTKNPLMTLEGNVKEVGKLKKVFEEAFKSEVKFYEKTVDFVQVVKLKGKVKTNLVGKVEYMVCDDKQCLPPSESEFKINIGG